MGAYDDYGFGRIKFPVLAFKFPVPSQKFPVLLCREFGCKPLNFVRVPAFKIAPSRRIRRNSLFFSLLAGNLPRSLTSCSRRLRRTPARLQRRFLSMPMISASPRSGSSMVLPSRNRRAELGTPQSRSLRASTSITPQAQRRAHPISHSCLKSEPFQVSGVFTEQCRSLP